MTPVELETLFERMRAGDPYIFGAVQPPLSTKDFLAPPAPPGAAPPAWRHPGVGHVPVLDQQGATCVGNSIATCLSYLEWAEKQDVVAFDGEALNARVTHKEGEATWASTVLDAILAQGAPSQGGLYFPKAYARVDPHDTEAIKAAMVTPGSMLTGAFWIFGADSANDPNCWGTNPRDYYDPTPNPNNQGYHEMTFVAYDDRGVLLQNSWDRTWGANGCAYASWHYIMTQCTDAWVITDNDDTAGGFVRTYQPPLTAERAIKRSTRPAVYRLLPGAREWVKDIWVAKRLGIDLSKVEVLPESAKEWALPVLGPDAPRNLR